MIIAAWSFYRIYPLVFPPKRYRPDLRIYSGWLENAIDKMIHYSCILIKYAEKGRCNFRNIYLSTITNFRSERLLHFLPISSVRERMREIPALLRTGNTSCRLCSYTMPAKKRRRKLLNCSNQSYIQSCQAVWNDFKNKIVASSVELRRSREFIFIDILKFKQKITRKKCYRSEEKSLKSNLLSISMRGERFTISIRNFSTNVQERGPFRFVSFGARLKYHI